MKRRAFLGFAAAAPIIAAITNEKLIHSETGAEVPVDQPLIFQDGKLFLNSAQIGHVSAGTLRNKSGSMEIRLGEGAIILRG